MQTTILVLQMQGLLNIQEMLLPPVEVPATEPALRLVEDVQQTPNEKCTIPVCPYTAAS